MEDLNDVYNELIMEHSMNSYNKKKLDKVDFCEIGHNPNCGDEITLELKKLEDAIAFRNVANMPARVKCALLAWHTVEDILNKKRFGLY